MNVRVRRFDASLPLPAYKTPGAAAMDLAVREEVTIAPQSVGSVTLNIALKPPPGHFVLMAARSSLHKKGLMMANNVAIFDEDYCGDNDEYRAVLYNFSANPVTLAKGERITQIIALPFDRIVFEEVAKMDDPSRGGFGTTGN